MNSLLKEARGKLLKTVKPWIEARIVKVIPVVFHTVEYMSERHKVKMSIEWAHFANSDQSALVITVFLCILTLLNIKS